MARGTETTVVGKSLSGFWWGAGLLLASLVVFGFAAAIQQPI
jgi:hypothetical protein